MIQQRDADLEADRHAGAVHLGQDVVREIGHRIQELHVLREVREIAPDRIVPEDPSRLPSAADHSIRAPPLHDESTVEITPVFGLQEVREQVCPAFTVRRPGRAKQGIYGERGKGMEQGGDRRAERVGPSSDAPPERIRAEIAVVAGKQFVAAVAGQRHGNVVSGDPRDQASGDLRRIGERFVEPGGESRHDAQDVIAPGT